MEHERGKGLRGFRLLLFVLSLIFVAVVVYSPHIKYPFPFHIDEWRHITETYKMLGGKSIIENNFEFGFHLLLALISFLGDLVLIYKFLPAVIAVLAALSLFLFVRQDFGFWSAVASIFFFASLKTNTNLLGLWFFTPLTACIPLIYLFLWLFTRGIEEKKLKTFLWSIPFFILILLIHPVSATFMLPILVIFLLMDASKKESFVKKYALLLISTTVVLALVFMLVSLGLTGKSPSMIISWLVSQLRFNYGWGVIEIFYNPLAFYNIMPSMLAILGLFFAIKNNKWIFVIWPVITLISLFCYPFFRFSLFAPYQRMFYYFLLSIVPLSGIGLVGLITFIRNLNERHRRKVLDYAIVTIFVIFALIGTFFNYYIHTNEFNDIEGRKVSLKLYESIDATDYKALLFLRELPEGGVMALPLISEAIYPVSKQEPMGTLYFYGYRPVPEGFFSNSCAVKEVIISKANVSYVYHKSPIECGWNVIYDEGAYIYNVSSIRFIS